MNPAPATPLAAVVEALREACISGAKEMSVTGIVLRYADDYAKAHAPALLAKLAATADEREPAHSIVPRNGCCALCGAPVDRTRLYERPARADLEGWVMVPKDPTHQMCPSQGLRAAWAWALAAAPPPPRPAR